MLELDSLMIIAKTYGLDPEKRMLLRDAAEPIVSAEPMDLINLINDYGFVFTKEYIEKFHGHFNRYMSWNASHPVRSPKEDILKFLESL